MSAYPLSNKNTAFTSVADRCGATASFLCAVHCAALPFVIALLPALGLNFLADHDIERGFVVFASCLALWSIGSSYLRHRVARVLWLLLPGLMLLWFGAFIIDEHQGLAFHATLVAAGGLLLAASHLTNLRLAHGHIRGMVCHHST